MADRRQILPQRYRAGMSALAGKPLAEGIDDRLGESLACASREFPRQPVGLRMLDAKRHIWILYV